VTLRGQALHLIPAEELLCIKAYVLQRDRCDWPDLLNLLFCTAATLDWNHVINRMKDDLPLHFGLLHVFNWLAPAEAAQIPAEVRARFQLPDSSGESNELQRRVALLDSRPWFAAFQPADKPMQL
jgi:hypothetical protein